MSLPNSEALAQAGKVTFELHTLGWEAFQNLCGHIAREVLGQTATLFSSSNDAGQDGAFQGEWKRNNQETFAGRFVLQCKFTARRDEHLSLSNLKEELAKAANLAVAGSARTYLLITNAKVSGEADKAIRAAFAEINGIDFFDIFGEEWITQQILTCKRLRAYVPRIYGLGDLSEILDERVYGQASEILESWRDNLAKFVPTDAHRRSVDALIHHGFVLLLGDPMAGKSTIAAALMLAAADQWGCRVIFVRHPEDIREHWNPNEPKQIFWVDDVFGQTQVDSLLAAGWNRVFPYAAAAIRGGARVLFTSRTYVYRAALRELKQSAFPLLKHSQVVIDVERLSTVEKERILYNHLRLGHQPQRFRRAIKPHLAGIASNAKFSPEIAKRLADPFFTKNLHIAPDSLRRFVEEPKELLGEIVDELDRLNFAALALLFMRAGQVAIPPSLDSHEAVALELLGGNLAGVCDAFKALDGSLVGRLLERGERFWTFRHPTVRDAMADKIAARPELVDVYIRGVKPVELLREVVCGEFIVEGAKVHVPASRYRAIITKMTELNLTDWGERSRLVSFLVTRCSDEFLRAWAAANDAQLRRLFEIITVANSAFALLLAKLHELGCLKEVYRAAYAEEVADRAAETGEATFLQEHLRPLLTSGEFEMIIERVKAELVPNLEYLVDQLTDEYEDPEGDPREHFSELEANLSAFREFFENDATASAFDDALFSIESASEKIDRRNEERKREEELRKEEEHEELMRSLIDDILMPSSYRPTQAARVTPRSVDPPEPPRSIFDDIDA